MNPGPYFRKEFPKVYYKVISAFNAIRNLFSPYTIYITDSLGGSFKTYLKSDNIEQKKTDLCRNLDSESVETVNLIVLRLKCFPDEKDRHKMPRKTVPPGGFLPVERNPTKRMIMEELSFWKNRLSFMSDHIEESVFYFYHGLIFLPETISTYIEDNDFIDIGAYIGDSAIALRKYKYKKIFSIEMSPKSILSYKENLTKFGIGADRYEIINAAIAAEDSEQRATLYDTGSSGLSLFRKKGKYDQFNVQMITLDKLCSEYCINPKFIKVDIEGSALDFVKGAVNTLKEFRPVLSVAIYHNPFEFFEVKPLLEEILEDYVFMIRKLSSGIEKNLCHSETILLGYPKDVIKSRLKQ